MGTMNSGEILPELVGALDQAQIPYMIFGSFASNLYGSGRGTQDIDIVISATPDQIRAFLGALGILRERYDLLDLGYVQQWIKELGLCEQWDAARKAAGLQ